MKNIKFYVLDEKESLWYFIVFILISICCGNILGNWQIFGLICFIWSLVDLFNELGTCIPFASTTQILAGFQWIIAPSIVYSMNNVFYFMVIPKKYYMFIVVPAYLTFCLGLRICKNNTLLLKNKINLCNEFYSLDFFLLLCIISIVSYIIRILVPSTYVITDMLYGYGGIAAVYGICVMSKKKVICITMLWCVCSGVITGFFRGYFHSFLLWCFWLFAFIAYRFKPSIKMRIIWLLIVIFCVVTLQFIKTPFRNSTKQNIQTMGEIVYDVWNSSSNMYRKNMWERFNEGWAISQVIYYIDETKNLQYGRSIIDSLKAIFLPRFISKNKRKAGGRENFESMTFYKLNQRTSMNVSYVGEGYANFGRIGGCIYTFLIGLGLQGIMRFIIYLHLKYKYYLLFAPLILFNCIRAENDMLSALGQSFRAFLLTVLTIIIIRDIKHSKQVIVHETK